jgi:hypothetical protein
VVKRTPCVEKLKSQPGRSSAKSASSQVRAQGDVGDRKGDIPSTGIVTRALQRVTLRVTPIRIMGGVRSTRPGQSTRGDTMPGPSSAANRRPNSSTCPRAGRGTLTPVKQGQKERLRLVRGTGGRAECAQTSPDVQVVLVTEGGLELPLVASPVQVAQLLESVSEMAAGVDCDGLLLSPGLADRRAHPVRMDQVLSRVRVVVQRSTSTEGHAS